MLTSLGSRIRRAREDARFKQGQLAEMLGVQQNMLSRWELGKTEPSTFVLKEVARLLNVELQWLKTGEGPMQPLPTMRPEPLFPEGAFKPDTTTEATPEPPRPSMLAQLLQDAEPEKDTNKRLEAVISATALLVETLAEATGAALPAHKIAVCAFTIAVKVDMGQAVTKEEVLALINHARKG